MDIGGHSSGERFVAEPPGPGLRGVEDEHRPVYSINWKDVVLLLESPVRKWIRIKNDGLGRSHMAL